MPIIKSATVVRLFQNRLWVTFYLEFFSGLPLALSGSTLQAWYTVAGINLVTLGILSLLGQPYVYKFLWAPLLDRYTLPWGGRRRGWMVAMQLLLALTIGIMACLSPANHIGLLSLLALFMAAWSATQDIAIDAYRTDLLKPAERGLGAAMVNGGYRLAMLVSGGLALVIAARLGWHFTYGLMAGLMLLGALITCSTPQPTYVANPPLTLHEAVAAPFREFWSRPGKYTLLLLIVCYKLSDAFALTLGTAFLIRGVGFSLVEVGMAYKTVGMGTMLCGSLLGGLLLPRLGLYRALWYFGLLQGVSNLMFMWLAMVGKSLALMVSAVFVESFCSGLGSVAFVALLMSLCDHRYTATQFALFSALSAVGRVFVGPLAGVVAAHWGWVNFYFCSVGLAVPGLVLLIWLRPQLEAESMATLAETS